MKDIVVYSCITGDIDTFKSDQNWGCADWVMYTDQYFSGGKWQIRPSTRLFNNPRRNARYHKTTSHELFPDYKYSIWIDGSMQLFITPEELIKKYAGDNQLSALTHPDRDCPFDEAVACVRLGKDDPELICKQMEKYKENGLKRNSGLAETKIVIRRNSGVINDFNNMWTVELLNNSLRDQLSFNYCAWMNDIKVNYMPSWKDCKDIKYWHHHETKK